MPQPNAMTDRELLTRLLQVHMGKANGISSKHLAVRMTTTERHLRKVISDLREQGLAICGHPSTGYYLAETAEELEETCAYLRSRAMHSLVLESRLRKQPLAELLGQLRLAPPLAPTTPEKQGVAA